MLGILTITLAIGLTAILFVTRQVFLGFAAAGGWAVFGAYCYTQSTATWDIYYALAFFSLLGMVTVCAYGAYAMRKQDRSMVEEADEIEEPSELGEEEEYLASTEPVSRSEWIRARANKRRGKAKVRRMLEGKK